MMKLVKDYFRDLIVDNNMFLKNRWESHYQNTGEDPWGYKSNSDDIYRKDRIISLAKEYAPVAGFSKALDIGAGEGWITMDLPAEEIFGYDASALAMSRFPSNVKPLYRVLGRYDCIIATGVLYDSYNYRGTIKKINKCGTSIVITSHIKDLEKGISMINATQVYQEEFNYKEYIQIARVFKK